MERIIELLREKNQYLQKFQDINERELANFDSGHFENVESFYRMRDKILDLIRCIDDLLDDETQSTAVVPVPTVDQKHRIEDLLAEKDQLVSSILDQDLKVLACIEKEKSNIIRELQSVRKGRKVLRAYHSGEKNARLDEEA